MQWVELRAMWNKSLQALSDTEIADALKILAKYKPARDRYCEPAVSRWTGLALRGRNTVRRMLRQAGMF